MPNVARFMLDHGLFVDYFSRRPDSGGTRWVYMGDPFAGSTIATWNGATLSDAGVWTNASDRALKDGFETIDTRVILEQVAALPVSRWHYRSEGAHVQHLGPTAQDFRATFGLGHTDTGIGTVDADGVALAAIQGLNAKVEEAIRVRDERLAVQERELAAQRAEIAALRREIAAVMARVN